MEIVGLDLVVGVEDWSYYGWDDAWSPDGTWMNGPLHGWVYLFLNTGATQSDRNGHFADRWPSIEAYIAWLEERLTDMFRLLRGGDRAADARQQTLWDCIDWSYKLLTPREQAVLRWLSVFTGGWTLEAAEAVLRTIVDIYPQPNLAKEQIRAGNLNGEEQLKRFSEICRRELESVQRHF